MHLLPVAGNPAISSQVRALRRLQTPVYFFLCNLSSLESWFAAACVPQTLAVLTPWSWALHRPCCPGAHGLPGGLLRVLPARCGPPPLPGHLLAAVLRPHDDAQPLRVPGPGLLPVRLLLHYCACLSCGSCVKPATSMTSCPGPRCPSVTGGRWSPHPPASPSCFTTLVSYAYIIATGARTPLAQGPGLAQGLLHLLSQQSRQLHYLPAREDLDGELAGLDQGCQCSTPL